MVGDDLPTEWLLQLNCKEEACAGKKFEIEIIR